MARLKPKPDSRKGILQLAALAVVITCLFPPWLFTFERFSTSDSAGARSEQSAGYSLIFIPPKSDWVVQGRGWVEKESSGIKLDMRRLFVEWVCILAMTGAAWSTAALARLRPSQDEPNLPA